MKHIWRCKQIWKNKSSLVKIANNHRWKRKQQRARLLSVSKKATGATDIRYTVSLPRKVPCWYKPRTILCLESLQLCEYVDKDMVRKLEPSIYGIMEMKRCAVMCYSSWGSTVTKYGQQINPPVNGGTGGIFDYPDKTYATLPSVIADRQKDPYQQL